MRCRRKNKFIFANIYCFPSFVAGSCVGSCYCYSILLPMGFGLWILALFCLLCCDWGQI